MNLLDTILDAGSNPIISQQHDTNAVTVELASVEAAMARVAGAARVWDAAEYGISREEAERRVRAAQTPEARARVIADLKALALRRAGLDTSNGRVNAAFAGRAAWHGLGTVVRDAMDSYTALCMSGMNFEVEKVENSYTWNGQTFTNPDSFTVIRKDTGAQLGTVGSRYKPFQNRECFAFMDTVLAEFGAKYETAGSIYGGRRVWMLAKLPAHRFCVTAGDCTESYALLSNCHDGSGAIWVMPTTERIECANTLRMALTGRTEKALAINHTGDLQSKISKARQALGIAINAIDHYAENAAAMVSAKVDVKRFANGVLDEVLAVTEAQAMSGAELLAAALDADKAEKEEAYKTYSAAIRKRETILEDILARYEDGRCNPQGSVWAAFNAVTEHADHAKIGPQARDAHTRASRRFESVLTGDADTMKQAAYQAATALLA